MAKAKVIFLKDYKRSIFSDVLEPQDVCPNCGSDNIANEDAPDNGVLHVTCHSCSYQWHELDE